MNRGRLAEIYREQRQGLFSLALKITRRRDRAEDAVHDAFLRLCRANDPSGDDIAYVYRSVRNAAIDSQRRRQEQGLTPKEAESLFTTASPTPSAGIERSEQLAQLRQGVSELPPEQSEAVVMKIYGGLTFEQIAEVLEAPLSTVASRYRRALARLRQNLGRLV